MRYVVALTLLILLTFALYGQKVKGKEQKLEVVKEDSCDCTTYKTYYESGKLNSIATHKHMGGINSQLHGYSIHYFEKGGVALSTYYYNKWLMDGARVVHRW